MDKHRLSWRILLIGMVVGLLYIGPPLMIWKYFSANDKTFVLAQFKTTRDALYTYLPRDREIYDGHFPPSDLYAEDDEKPTIRPILPPLVFSYFIRAFAGNINWAYLTVQFLFSGIIFSLFYLVGWLLSKNQLWSVFLGLVATLTPIPLILPFGFEGTSEFASLFLKNFAPIIKTQIDKLYLHDIENPLLTYPFYLGAIISLIQFVKKPKPITAILAGTSAGILAYVYFHIWLFWMVASGLVCLGLVIKYQNSKILKNCALLLATAFIIILPYLISYLQLKNDPKNADYVLRLGVLNSREIGLDPVNAKDFAVYLALGMLIHFYYRRRDPVKHILGLSIVGAMLTIWNIQVLTGFVPVPHTWRKAISPVIFILVFMLIHDFAQQLEERKPKLKKLIAVGLIILSLTVTVKKTINVAAIAHQPQPFVLKYYKFYDTVVNSWQWINENLEHEPQVLSPSTLTSLYLNSYTSARPFLPTAFLTSMTMEEVEGRYLLAHRAFQVSDGNLARRLRGDFQLDCEGYDCPPDQGSNLNDSAGHIYGNYFLSRYGTFDDFTGEKDNTTPAERAKHYQTLIKRYGSLRGTAFADVNADYVYSGPLEKQISNTNLSKNPRLKTLFKNSRVEIYQVTKL